ncbi:MAG: HAD-IIIA family hydrolase [Chitinophagaceae bacterium]|nr:MAG: HAD-IIIA family hydrolase [Chitinophagaceae bacterium]
MITEAIVLAGGLGTRLRSAVPDLPKCMAPVAGRPFLGYVIDSLRRQGIQRFVFSLGYLSEAIEHWLKETYPTLEYATVVEEEPLGTGGGIAFALGAAKTEQVLVANGDTLFEIDLAKQWEVHQRTHAHCTLALKPMRDFDRYGSVLVDENGRVHAFREKSYQQEGLINGGIYLLHKAAFLSRGLPQKFSFEKDFLEPAVQQNILAAAVHDGYFIDIGIPEDFARAQTELRRTPLDLSVIDKGWTLFLDRDGVINDERVGHYVLHPGEFTFSKGVLDAMPSLAQRFGQIFLVTNQRGVSKGLMTPDDLEDVHRHMLEGITQAGGRVDDIFVCTEKDDRCFSRKPNPGMAVQAAQRYPRINLRNAIMVGNKPSDMRFGRAAGVYTVFIASTNPHQPYPHPDIDLRFNSLLEFAEAVEAVASES